MTFPNYDFTSKPLRIESIYLKMYTKIAPDLANGHKTIPFVEDPESISFHVDKPLLFFLKEDNVDLISMIGIMRSWSY